MDGQRFDNLIRRIGQERSRRSVVVRVAQGSLAAALAAVGLGQGTVEEVEAAQLDADATQKKCRRRCQNKFRRRRKRGVRLNKLRSQRRRCFRRCRPKPTSVTSCTVDVQCAEGRVCENGVCTTLACTPTGDECGSNFRECVDNVCVPLSCESALDCPPGGLCSDQVCIPPVSCESVVDCGAGQDCVDNVCVPDPTATCEDDADCDILYTCDTSSSQCIPRVTCTEQAGCGGSEICLVELGICVENIACGAGQTCDDGQLCVLDICLGVSCLVSGLTCESSAECCGGLVCRNTGVLGRVCLP